MNYTQSIGIPYQMGVLESTRLLGYYLSEGMLGWMDEVDERAQWQQEAEALEAPHRKSQVVEIVPLTWSGEFEEAWSAYERMRDRIMSTLCANATKYIREKYGYSSYVYAEDVQPIDPESDLKPDVTVEIDR